MADRHSATPRPRSRRGSSASVAVPTGPANATRSRGQTPVAGMQQDPMRRGSTRASSNVPNAGQHGHLTNQPTKNSTSYGGAGAVSAGVPTGGSPNQNTAAPSANFENSFAPHVDATPGPASGRGRGTSAGRGTSVGLGRGRGASHPLSPIHENSSASATPASGAGRGSQPDLNGAPSMSGHDDPLPSIEGPDNTFRNETIGPQTIQSAEPREPSPAESVDPTHMDWTKVRRLGSSVVSFSSVMVALLFYGLIAFAIADMLFFARQDPRGYLLHRKGQVNILFHSSEATQQLRTDQAALARDSRRLDDRLTNMVKQISLLDDGYNKLKKNMPENLILPSIDENGHAIIPESFWTAARAFSQATGRDEPEGLEFWRHFVDNNAARLEAYLSTDANSLLKKAVQNDVVVDRDTVITMIQDRINQLGETMPHIVHANLTYALDQVIVANMRETLTTVNFLSLGMGAKANPDMTSPTLEYASEWFGGGIRYLKNIWIPGQNHREGAGYPSPGQALRSWQEENDCWCTPKSTKGQAQLAVRLRHNILPTRLVVEHIPRGATIDITTAPRRIELWVEVTNADKRKELRNAVREMIASRPSQDTDKPTNGLESLKEEYVFVGSFDYDINAPNYVQSFEPLVSLAGLGIPIKDTVVRVASNYGQEFTCLYRIRMLGELVDKVNVRHDNRW